MLDVLRRGAQTWVAKLLMAVLVLSFGVWGISGTLFSSFGGGNSVVTVGNVKVSPTEFRLAYDREMTALSQRFHTRLTSQQAKALGVEGRVFSQLASGAALDQLGRDMNLGVSQDRLAKYIAEDPAFHDSQGNFSRQAFRAVLQNVGMTEKGYIENRTAVAMRSQIVDSVGNGFKPPVVLVDAFLQHRDEARDVEYMLVNKDVVAKVGSPDPKALQAFFDKHKADYRAPEYRKIAYVTLTPKDIADPSSVSDADAKTYYDDHKSDYGEAERRTIDQLTFPDKKAAEAAEQKLKNGTSFDDLAKAQGKSTSDIRLGTYTKQSFPDKALADAAFAVDKQGGTTDVVSGSFGPVILRVAEIKPSHVKPFAEVEKEVKQQLAVENANNDINDVQNAYEDARAGGATLQEAAKKEGLQPVVVDAVDSSGQTPAGKKVENLPDEQDLLKAAFANQEGDEIPSLNYGSNGYLWVEVLGVTKAHDRPLKDVRDKVVADWTAEQYRQEIASKAADIKKSVDGGKSLKEVAAGLGASLETKQGIKRSDTDAVFGRDAVDKAFGGANGVVAVADTAGDASTKIVLHVTGVHRGTANGYDALQPEQMSALSDSTSNSLLGQMVAALQKRYGVAVNQDLAQQSIERY